MRVGNRTQLAYWPEHGKSSDVLTPLVDVIVEEADRLQIQVTILANLAENHATRGPRADDDHATTARLLRNGEAEQRNSPNAEQDARSREHDQVQHAGVEQNRESHPMWRHAERRIDVSADQEADDTSRKACEKQELQLRDPGESPYLPVHAKQVIDDDPRRYGQDRESNERVRSE